MTHELYTDLPMHEYLRMPAVGSQVIQAMVDDCPYLAWHASHLNALRPPDDSDASDRGTIAHKILLEGNEAGVAIIDPNDHPAEKGGGIPTGWTNKSIRQARDAARAGGLIPILAPQMGGIRDMVSAARRFLGELRETEPHIFAAFKGAALAEASIVWNEDGIACKMRPDLLARDYGLVINYKTTQTSVNPERWGRGPFLDYYVGAAWYRRGLRHCFDVEAEYVYLVQSCDPPYLCSLIGVDPRAMAIGEAKCEWALSRWRSCVKNNLWPGYPPRVAYPELPAWIEAAWEAQQVEEWTS